MQVFPQRALIHNAAIRRFQGPRIGNIFNPEYVFDSNLHLGEILHLGRILGIIKIQVPEEY